MHKIFSITSFSGQAESLRYKPRNIAFDESYILQNWLVNGDTYGLYSTLEEAEEAFAALDASVSMCDGYPRGSIISHDSYALESAEIGDDYWDDDEDLFYNDSFADHYEVLATKVQPCFVDDNGLLRCGAPFDDADFHISGGIMTITLKSASGDSSLRLPWMDIVTLFDSPDEVVSDALDQFSSDSDWACCTDWCRTYIRDHLFTIAHDHFTEMGYEENDDGIWVKED